MSSTFDFLLSVFSPNAIFFDLKPLDFTNSKISLMTDALSQQVREMLQREDSPHFLHLPACIDITSVPVGDLLQFTSEHGRSIFQQVTTNSEAQDDKRLQIVGTDVPVLLRRTYTTVNAYVRDLVYAVDPTMRVSPESLIVSLPGCIPQSFHGDYDYENPASRRSFFVLVGLMTSRLHYLEFHGNITIAKVLTYSAGDIVVCRGDLIHAGAGYTDANIRLHYYADLPRTKHITPARKLDKTYIFSDDAGYYEFSYYSRKANFQKMSTQVHIKRRHHGDHCAKMRAAKKAYHQPLPQDETSPQKGK